MSGIVRLTCTAFPSFDIQLSRMKPKIVKGKEGYCLSGGVDTNFLHQCLGADELNTLSEADSYFMESKSNLEALSNQRQLDEHRPVIYSSETFWEAVRICHVRVLIKTVNHRFLFVQHLSAMKNVIKLFIATIHTGRQVSQHCPEYQGTAEVLFLIYTLFFNLSW